MSEVPVGIDIIQQETKKIQQKIAAEKEISLNPIALQDFIKDINSQIAYNVAQGRESVHPHIFVPRMLNERDKRLVRTQDLEFIIKCKYPGFTIKIVNAPIMGRDGTRYEEWLYIAWTTISNPA